jgi:transcriptional regulator with XRE-family HTH domain
MSNAQKYAQWALEPYCIALKLRALRTQKRLTLSRLAAQTGLSAALLSKLETDQMIPTLPTLATIGRVYGVGLSHFFSEPDHHVLSITRKAHLQSPARGPEAMKTIPLSPLRPSTGLQAEMIEVPTDSSEALSGVFNGATRGVGLRDRRTPAPGFRRLRRNTRCGRLCIYRYPDAPGLEGCRKASLPRARGAARAPMP